MKKRFRVSSCERKLLARVLSSLLQFVKLIAKASSGKGTASSAYVLQLFAKSLYFAIAHDPGTWYGKFLHLGFAHDRGTHYRYKNQLALVVNMDSGHVR